MVVINSVIGQSLLLNHFVFFAPGTSTYVHIFTFCSQSQYFAKNQLYQELVQTRYQLNVLVWVLELEQDLIVSPWILAFFLLLPIKWFILLIT